MTWKEFKEQLEEGGVKDDMKIQFIDVNCGFHIELLKSVIVLVYKEQGEFTVVGGEK